jgi:hypothetical protein
MSYKLLISSIAEVHARTQADAAGAVNRHLTLRNWFIGAYIVEFEQNGEDRASYGQKLLPRLARDLRRRGVPGCSPEMLGRMRVFYRIYPRLSEAGSSPFAAESGTIPAPTAPTEISSPAVTKSNTALPTPLDGRRLEGLGGGIAAFGGAAQSNSVLTLNSVYVVQNTAAPNGGGGIFTDGVTLALTNTTVKDNVGGQICDNNTGCQ